MKAEVLEAIIKFADAAHGEQKRKYSGERYIVHPVKVMQICQQYSSQPYVLAAALLHDVLEDTPVTREEILAFLRTVLDNAEAEKCVRIVVELTDVYIKEDYPLLNRQRRKQKEFDRLSRTSSEAQTIKYADIMDNAVDLVQHDRDFGYRFLQEAKKLLAKIPKGNEVLYQRTLHTVDVCMEKVRKIST